MIRDFDYEHKDLGNAQHSTTLINKKTGSRAEIFSFGSLLNSYSVTNGEKTIQCIDGFESPHDAVENMTAAFKSSFLSPFTCRMAHGEYAHNGKKYKVGRHYLGDHAIHGLLLDRLFITTDFETSDISVSVYMNYTYKGDDPGYPFPFKVENEWILYHDDRLKVISTVVNNFNFPIPYAQGWHPYFNLGGKMDDCYLHFDGNEIVEFNDTLIPTGNLLKDDRFAAPRKLEGITLDNCFVLDPRGEKKCTLKNNDCTLTISPGKSYRYLQIYTPPTETASPSRTFLAHQTASTTSSECFTWCQAGSIPSTRCII